MNLKEFPDTKAASRWLYWISLAAVGLTVAHTIQQMRK